MKVQCKLCEFESAGFCTKKKRNTQPTKIKLNKRRSCSVYSEDPLRVLAQFRQGERHRAVLKKQEMRRAQFSAAVKQVRESGAAGFSASSEEE